MPRPPQPLEATVYRFGMFRLVPARRELRLGDDFLPLGGRAFDLLQYFVEHADRVVTKSELLDAIWPNRIVEENNLTVQITTVRRTLAQDPELAKAIATIPGVGYRFTATIATDDAPAAHSARGADIDRPFGNLPHPTTSFVGRDDEQEALALRIGAGRCISLVGIGGVGKTRLALQVAAQLATQFTDGAWLVDFAPISDPDQVAASICATLMIGGGETRAPETQLPIYLRSKNLLLLLDNCEHVIDSAAAVVMSLLKTCSGIAILVTSRESLNVPGESLFRLQPLPCPPPDQIVDFRAADQFGAVALFVARARSVTGAFEIDAETAGPVVEICRRVDGIALAIEMAVARLKVLTLPQLAQRLRERFELLTTADRTALPRQRTLLSVIDWSYEQLTDAERQLLMRLSIFAGSTDIEAMTAVARTILGDEASILDSLSSLVDKSLVVAETGRVARRFRLLETVRHFAAAKRREAGSDHVSREHATFYVERLEAAESAWSTTSSPDWIAAIADDVDNIRQALVWSAASEGDPDVLRRLAAASYPLWWELPDMPLREARRWFDRATADGVALPADHISARLWLGASWRDMRNNDQQNRPAAERAVEIFRALGDSTGLGAALWRLGTTIFHRDNIAEAASIVAESEALLRRSGPNKWLALALIKSGDVGLFSGDLETAQSRYLEAMELADRFQFWYAQTVCRTNFAEALFELGRGAEAINLLLDLRRDMPESRRPPGLAPLVAHLLIAGRLPEMRAVAAETIALANAVGFTAAMGWVMEALAMAEAAEGSFDVAARFAGYARSIHPMASARVGVRRAVFERLEADLAVVNNKTQIDQWRAEGTDWDDLEAEEQAMVRLQRLAD